MTRRSRREAKLEAAIFVGLLKLAVWLVLLPFRIVIWIVRSASPPKPRPRRRRGQGRRVPTITIAATLDDNFDVDFGDDDFNELGAFYTKIAGVTHRNQDGKSRQKLIKKCRVREILELKREPRNPYDRHAIAICRYDGSQLGYVNARMARKLAPWIDRGYLYQCVIVNLTGGFWKNRGVNVWIRHVEKAGIEVPDRVFAD